MAGWCHKLNIHESEKTLGDSEGQESLVCCSPWGCKKLDTTEQLNNNALQWPLSFKGTAAHLLLQKVEIIKLIEESTFKAEIG